MTLKNRFTLIGRVGSDPELSTGEKEFARFSVATDASYKKDGEKVERTDWHRLTCFKPSTLKVIREHVKKGQLLFVEGEIKPRDYEKDGIKHYVVDLHVTEIGFLSPKPNGSGDQE